MPEIIVENEPWLGLVVLVHLPIKNGYYVLARADEWHSDNKNVTVWRGPQFRDELVPRGELSEIDCQTVLVDGNGFYTCPPILEDLEENVKHQSEHLLGLMANESAVQSLSYIDDETAREYDGEVFIKSEVGDAVGVNGYLVVGKKDRKPPRNYELTNRGGHVPSGEEAELEKESLIEPISLKLTETMGRPIYPEAVKRILDKLYKKDYIYWNSDSGHTEVWASRRAIRKAESDEAREAREKEERYQRMIKQDRQRIEAERKREAEWRAQKIKRGGFPGPKDWSPRGRLPGER